MALDPNLVKTPDTDEWWIKRLTDKLGKDLPRLHELGNWMEGNPPLAVPDSDSAGFQRLQRVAKLNLAELIVNAVLYRMQPLTFKTSAPGDDNGDTEANKIWKRNNMKVASAEIIEWMLTYSRSYGIVGPRDNADPKAGVLLTSEHPTQVYAEPDPDNPGYSLAAIKIYRDDITESDVIVLYRSNYFRVARHYGNQSLLPREGKKSKWRIQPSSWEWDEAYDSPLYLENGAVVGNTFTELPPVFEFRNRQGKGEFEKHLATLERINHTILQRMIIIAFQAFRQRGIKGVPNTDEDGKEIDYTDIFAADPGAVWIVPELADFWESGQADLTPVLTSVKDDIIHLAVSSSTPLFSVVPDAANGSAEGAALQREGLIFKTEACIALADGAFCRMMGAAFEVMGDSIRREVEGIEGVWASAKRSSLQERASAAVQAKVAGVPWRTLMKYFLELTPDQIAEAESQRLDDAFMQSLMGPNQDVSIPGMTDPPRSTI
jgi:hypothetical protein